MNRMRHLSASTADQVNERFSARESELLAQANLDFEQVKPHMMGFDYQDLMQVVQDSTAANESIGQFRARLQALGSQGDTLLERIADIL